MNQLNISIFTSYSRIFIIFFALIICINNGHVSADDESIHLKNSIPEDIELNRRGVWSRLFRNEIKSPEKINSHSHNSPVEFVYVLKNGQIQLIPHDKRTIPLELRKAIYAHGIVGRRR